jgi:glycosyltransferase involved in cell wall biosynthesis
MHVIHPGIHEAIAPARRDGGYVLIVGNRFPHKAVQRAVSELQGVGEIVALGADASDLLNPRPGVRGVASGALSRSELARLYDGAAVVVYPSFYEGFGMPVVDALAMGIPVVALDMAVTRELKAQPGAEQLVLVDGPEALRAAVSDLLRTPPAAGGPAALRTWKATAAEYARALEELVERDIDLTRLRRRWELLATIDAIRT